MSKKTLLVLGGDSYIARYFIHSVLQHVELRVISRKPSGFPEEQIREDLFSVSDRDFHSVDLVVSFIGIAHQKRVKKEDFFRINTTLILHLAGMAKKAGVGSFLQMSSISVYGNNTLINEKTPAMPKDHYGLSKLKADQGLLKLSDEDFSVSLIRPPMVYGPECPGNFRKLVHFVHKQLPLPLQNAHEKRAFIYLGNLTDFLVHLSLNPKPGIFLISDPDSISVAEFVRLISINLNKRSFLFPLPIFFKSALSKVLPGLHARLFGKLEINFAETSRITGFVPNYNVREGLRLTLMKQPNKHP